MMNFKDLQFSLGKLSSDVRSHMAKKNPLHKQDTKALSVWIFQERNDLATMRTLAYRRGETNKSFKEWTTNGHEHWNDDDEYTDLQDIGDKLATLLTKANEIEQQYAARYQQYRHAIKSIRDREDALCDRREKRQSLAARLVHLEKTNPTSPKRQELDAELSALDNDTQVAEMELGDFKRFVLQEAFYIRFNALAEYADKMKMVAGFGKYIVDLLDVEPTTTAQQQQQQQQQQQRDDAPMTTTTTRKPYTSESQANLILNDCLLAIDQWQPSEEDERPTLASQAIHDASNDEDANLLTEDDIRYYREQGLASLTTTMATTPLTSSSATENEQQQQQQQGQPPVYEGSDGGGWVDEKHTPWGATTTTTHLGKRDEPASMTTTEPLPPSNEILPPAYTTTIQLPIPTTKQDNNTNTATTTSTIAPASSIIAETQDSQGMNYYQVYRNKQLALSSHQSRPYTSFQQQFFNNSNIGSTKRTNI